MGCEAIAGVGPVGVVLIFGVAGVGVAMTGLVVQVVGVLLGWPWLRRGWLGAPTRVPLVATGI